MVDMGVASSDGVVLAGSLHLPLDPRPSACVVALHAASVGTRDHFVYAHLRDMLVSAGVGVALFDRRGTGSSGGDPRASFYRLADDAHAVIRHVASHDSMDRDLVGVWGISQGGWLAAMIAAGGDAVTFVITVSASGVSPSSQMHYAMENLLRERRFCDHAVAEARAARSAIDEAHLSGDIDGARAARLRLAEAAWVRQPRRGRPRQARRAWVMHHSVSPGFAPLPSPASIVRVTRGRRLGAIERATRCLHYAPRVTR